MRKPFLAGMMLSALLGMTELPARGDVITTLFSTGSGLPSTGVTDPHWTVSGPAGSTITNGNGITIPPLTNGFFTYVTPPAGTEWLGPTNNNLTNQPVGTFTWTTTFTITSPQLASTALITGGVTADNQITSVLLNGHVVASNLGDPTLSFKALNAIVLDATSGPAAGDFVQGINTLQFLVNNTPGTPGIPNPTAFIAQLNGTVSSAIPEPSMVVLSGLGGVIVFGYRRIRRSGAKA